MAILKKKNRSPFISIFLLGCEMILTHLQNHAGFTVGDAGHYEAGTVAECDVLGECQSLEMFRLPGSLGNSDFLHC